jgi:hypothetical protein
MLANPVVVPAYATPEVWGLALLAMWAEIGTELALLRRMRMSFGALRPLLLINVATWLSFLLAIDMCDKRGVRGAQMVGVVAALEAGVVIVEALLMRAMIGRAMGSSPRQVLGLGQALRVSFLGNLVSIAVSIVAPIVLVWLFR